MQKYFYLNFLVYKGTDIKYTNYQNTMYLMQIWMD